mmetsp:Transcript_15872/g.30694  ORF Transcript_15872/g.30694 Transcript_15872/m.30694 type:complete len:303 (+) Transcript_15872:450-1358(+)|eukprot:CAMPEP_0171506758 /NCGR_PEP_ID=MMETSP0958-20121227/13112_1 /TAXON_ID=87120 /ORGANISM="Aurantiochytrium limacinum, Strain ATCCMYA-1381" /LENGTH=302 /DNA_ID=CAMNT_0012043361 /DNA_START=248 /DNA_END=1156 /DNA_ORIENTATION=+
MFQAVGDLVTLKWVREHPLVTATVAAAAAAYSFATVSEKNPDKDDKSRNSQDSSTEHQDHQQNAGSIKAKAKKKEATKSITWGDERGGKLAQFMDDSGTDKPQDGECSRATIGVQELSDESTSEEVTVREDKSETSEASGKEDGATAVVSQKASNEESKYSPARKPENMEQHQQHGENVSQQIDNSQGDSVLESKHVDENIPPRPAPLTRELSDEFESVTAARQSSLCEEEQEHKIFCGDADASGSSGDEAPSPQWGWFVTMTPPQQQMYGNNGNSKSPNASISPGQTTSPKTAVHPNTPVS